MPEVLEKSVDTSTANVTVPTTTETVIITSGRAPVPLATVRAVVTAWVQLTTGAGTTAVTPRIRRGSAVTDPLVGEATAEAVKAAAGSTEPFTITVSETLDNAEAANYSVTLQQTGATADGTALQAAIAVELLNG
jgi:hypothetical protein